MIKKKLYFFVIIVSLLITYFLTITLKINNSYVETNFTIKFNEELNILALNSAISSSHLAYYNIARKSDFSILSVFNKNIIDKDICDRNRNEKTKPIRGLVKNAELIYQIFFLTDKKKIECQKKIKNLIKTINIDFKAKLENLFMIYNDNYFNQYRQSANFAETILFQNISILLNELNKKSDGIFILSYTAIEHSENFKLIIAIFLTLLIIIYILFKTFIKKKFFIKIKKIIINS